MKPAGFVEVGCPAIRQLRTGQRACSGIVATVPAAWGPSHAVVIPNRHAARQGEPRACAVCGAWSEVVHAGLRAAS